jgi:hypothetical protein
MNPKILIGTFTEEHSDSLIVAGIRIELPEGMFLGQFPIGTRLHLAFTLEGDRQITAALRSARGPGSIHLLLTDVGTPLMRGGQLAHKVSAAPSRCQVLFM